MSNITVTNLPVATSVSGSAQLMAVQSGTSVSVTAQQIANLNANSGTVTSITASSPLSGGTITTTGTIGVSANSISNTYLSTMATNTIKGNNSGSTAQPVDLTVAQTNAMLGTGNLSGYTLLGNETSSTVANPRSFTLSAYIDSAISSAQGAILYRDATTWTALAPGSSGNVLQSGGASGNPSWVPVAGTGTVTSIATGTGLTGGPITGSGTISILNTTVTAGAYGSASAVGTFTVNAQGQLTAAATTSIAIAASQITSGIFPIANGGTGLSAFGTGVQTALGQNVTGSGGIVLATSPTMVTPILGAASATSVAMTTGTISTTPSNATDIVNKNYVDSVANGINFHPACNYASTADLGSVTYNNGTSGVGATLTNAGAQAALVIDGHTFTVTDVTNAVRILVKDESNGAYNGIYVLTNQGSVLTNWSMIRATDYDSTGSGTNEIDQGDFVYIISGTANANTSWVQQTALPITIGTTALVWIQFGSSATYTAGTGLTLAGTVFSVTNTAVTAGSYGSASTVPNYTVNAQGQLTAAASTAIAIAGSAITSGSVAATVGGTGQTSYAVGDLLYASTTTALSRLADVATGSILVSGGVSTAPVWSASPTITTSITTPLHIGGTAVSSTLTLQSTSGVGTTDSILFKVGNAGATTAMTISTAGLVTANNFGSSSSAITGGSINGTTVGASTASTGAFTTLSASSTVSGTGFSTYLASPPAIGGTAAAAGAFTTLSASSTVSGTGFSTYLASPPAIGGTAAAAGTFTTATAATVVGTHNAYANIIALTDAATIAVDMSVTGGNNFSVTLAGNRTLGNPTGLTAGQSGIIYITQDATGSRTLAYSSYWKFPGGTAPTLTVTASAVDALVYTVRTSTSITVQSLLNIA